MFLLEFRRQNGQVIRQICFSSEGRRDKVAVHIIIQYGLVEMGNNKRQERRYWNGNGIIMALYRENRIASVMALNEAERLLRKEAR